jgi:hypothetical protein
MPVKLREKLLLKIKFLPKKMLVLLSKSLKRKISLFKDARYIP